ncbi:TlpA disulfide reductase family protein [Chitinophaga sp.]|uniref:TlpA disulfide reductase family protein n=1 Tax=Chitinophaga sp. TaxID=1869181 RepID=UPI002CDAFF42|nr:TlpA disulfide reductase family protein [Chitinophaga sp.]HWV64490.1 TlpA disulfide reductase family protein [Chitinophaga sp.]
MKKLMLGCLATVAVSGAFAQKKSVITGKVPAAFNNEYIYLFSASENGYQKLDSALVEKGAFKLQYGVTDTLQAMLSFSTKGDKLLRGNQPLFITPVDKMTFTLKTPGEPNAMSGAVIKGSELTRQQLEMDAALAPATKGMDSLNTMAQKMMMQEKKDTTGYYAMVTAYRKLAKEKDELQEKFMLSHTNYYVSLVTFYENMGGRVEDIAGTQQLLDKFPLALRESGIGQKATALLKASALLGKNQVAPDFSAPTPDGKTMKLSDLRGKYVLLDFWASWCGPCRAENPNVVKAYNKFKDKNFDILGVSLDRTGDAAKWTAAIEKDGLAWHHVSDLKWWKSDIAKLYMIHSIPQNFLLDPQGRIIATNLRGEALEKELEKVLH